MWVAQYRATFGNVGGYDLVVSSFAKEPFNSPKRRNRAFPDSQSQAAAGTSPLLCV
ncbi:hypothetical protein [Allorhodopirellula solitaria]|uniref:hypothetical protein n=1 Tax=Allorhodopirellula solitaria TaxID=2527987 RepID=UPI001C96302B|nr:hypothetical protein [Allorhodopirellula solitaria]